MRFCMVLEHDKHGTGYRETLRLSGGKYVVEIDDGDEFGVTEYREASEEEIAMYEATLPNGDSYEAILAEVEA